MLAEFITKVDNVLRSLWCSSTTTTTSLDSFVVNFKLSRKHRYHIDRWISFSTVSRAKHIALDFMIERHGSEGYDLQSQWPKQLMPSHLICAAYV